MLRLLLLWVCHLLGRGRGGCRLSSLSGRRLGCRLGFLLDGLRHLLKLLDVFAIDEVYSVGVDNSGIVVFALDFEVVSDEADGTAGIHSVGWLVRRISERSWSSAASLVAMVAVASMVSASLATVVEARIVLAMVMLLSVPLIVALVLAVIATALTMHHVLLATHMLLLPRLAPTHVVRILVAPAEVLLGATHVRLVGGTLPVLLTVLVVSGVVLLLVVVLHSRHL